jgi:hypothetical protein
MYQRASELVTTQFEGAAYRLYPSYWVVLDIYVMVLYEMVRFK